MDGPEINGARGVMVYMGLGHPVTRAFLAAAVVGSIAYVTGLPRSSFDEETGEPLRDAQTGEPLGSLKLDGALSFLCPMPVAERLAWLRLRLQQTFEARVTRPREPLDAMHAAAVHCAAVAFAGSRVAAGLGVAHMQPGVSLHPAFGGQFARGCTGGTDGSEMVSALLP